MRRIAAIVLGAALVAGLPFAASAAKKIPLSDARYSGEVTVASKDAVRITVMTFDPAPQRWSGTAAAGGMYVPVSGNVKPQYLFTVADQQALADILQAELLRLEIVQAAPEAPHDVVDMALHFKSGTYRNSNNEYTLSLEMSLRDQRGRTSAMSYLVNSNENASRWSKLNTSVWKGKMQLVQVALDKLIPDIQDFLAEDIGEIPQGDALEDPSETGAVSSLHPHSPMGAQS